VKHWMLTVKPVGRHLSRIGIAMSRKAFTWPFHEERLAVTLGVLVVLPHLGSVGCD
jgi:hypothetical protein